MKFQSFCSTRSSNLCAFFGASSSSNFGAMKHGIIGVTTSPSSRSSRMTVCAVSFRPCIDIHQGKVKQIVGSTLRDSEQDGSTLLTNFETDKSAAYYANMYKQDGLTGGHAIMLGADPLSVVAALDALHAHPGGLQVGGGINSENASSYIEEGASHVIVTSYVFNNGQMDLTRLEDLVRIVGKQRLVLDLSCRKKEGKYAIVTDRWQKFSDVFLDEEVLAFLADYADEFLVHGVDVEGKKLGIDEELVTLLGKYSSIPVTYAGGVTTMADLERIKDAGMGRVDVTVGSALDIFGGNMAYKDVVAWHARQKGLKIILGKYGVNMDEDMKVSLDKLPVKRLEAIEENGLERFPSDVGYEEKRLSLIRRIDFAWAIEKDDDKKKQKKSSKESSTPWQWQNMIENLQLAHQELSVIIDLINTVEANDAVTVAGMTRPKPLPNEVLADLGVSVATKLQCFRHLGKYFKQSAKGLERQVAREARFYGALIRLQQNWKVKRQRVAAPAPANEGFTIDLFDNSSCDPSSVFRPSSSTIRVDHDSSGMLAINLPPNSCHSLRFGFLSGCNVENPLERDNNESTDPSNQSSLNREKEFTNDDEYIKETNSLLRQVHHAIFSEQVFDLVNHEAFNPSVGINVTGIRENYLQLSIDQGTSVFISLVPSGQSCQTVEGANSEILENANLPFDSLDGIELPDRSDPLEKKLRNPNHTTFEIYLQQIFHELVFVKSNDRPISSLSRQSGQVSNDGSGLLGHFCSSLAHRMFANNVLMELENVVWKVPFLQLISHPTWNSRKSSWTFFMEVPRSILHPNSIHTRTSDGYQMNNVTKTQFLTKVVVNDDCITIEGEGAPNVVGLFNENSKDIYSTNRYSCDLADLPVIILLQVASQIILWLHEEALTWGIKANRDFLSLSFELEQGETLRLVAHVDPEDPQGCLSWWLVMDDGLMVDRKLNFETSDVVPEYRKFLGHLSLEVLHSTLMDLVSLCSGVGGSL